MKSSATTIAVKKRKIFPFTRTTTIEIISALFILLFVYTGISKFLSLDSLKYVLKDYPLIGGYPIMVAWVLPTVELLIASMLFIPRTRLLGLYCSLGLMTSFTFYLIYMLMFTPKLPCTCGGMLEKLTWSQHLIFNMIFIMFALIGIWLAQKPQLNFSKEEVSDQVIFT
jgi:putative oxidoreductase